MINEQSSVQPCARCGRAVVVPESHSEVICEACAVNQNGQAQGFEITGTAFPPTPIAPYPPAPQQEFLPAGAFDPDRPPWGVPAGFGVWLASVAALLIIPVILVLVWFFVQGATGHPVPMTQEGIREWAVSPTIILVQIVATMVAQIITVGICWAVATGFGKRSFAAAIGWQWEGPAPLVKAGLVVGITVLAVFVLGLLSRIIPNRPTPFDEMLKASQAVRYVVAFLAVFTAPAVEEFVYRGLLYSPLKRALGMAGAVTIATLLFALVHVPQYWGAWGALTGLLVLSLVLTVIRAKTRSIFPSVAIHTLFNFVGAIAIVLGKE